MNEATYIIINPYCHQGRGWKRWESIRKQVVSKLQGATEMISEKGFDLESFLLSVKNKERTCFISAGGDGTIHSIANVLLRNRSINRSTIRVGAIGLGSSNDFLKPFGSFINNIPVRINLEKPGSWQDAGRLLYNDEQTLEQEKFFVVNASFGATAEGNWNFNHPGSLLRWLKKTHTGMAISYTSIATIIGSRNNECTIRYNNIEKTLSVSNINLLKIPYVAGSLFYNQAITPDDRRFGLNICAGMNRIELVNTLAGLSKGKFKQNEKKISAYTDHFELESKKPVVFECDGETAKATYVKISLIPKAIQFLSH